MVLSDSKLKVRNIIMLPQWITMAPDIFQTLVKFKQANLRVTFTLMTTTKLVPGRVKVLSRVVCSHLSFGSLIICFSFDGSNKFQ